jgi:hypothetical protein
VIREEKKTEQIEGDIQQSQLELEPPDTPKYGRQLHQELYKLASNITILECRYNDRPGQCRRPLTSRTRLGNAKICALEYF